MAEDQTTSTRRRVLETIGAAGAVAVAGCTSTSSSPASGESEDDGSETGGSEEQGKTGQDEQENSGDEENNQDQASELEQNIRNGIPLDGLGAYTDQMLDPKEGPVREETTEKVNAILEGSVEEQRDALVEVLTEENYEMLFSEYHRQIGEEGGAENQVVLNRNWSFTSDSEPIFEFYLVENGDLQSQPVILDPDPETYNRQVNKPGTGEPEYLAWIRDSSIWGRTVPQDWKAEEDRRNAFEEWTEAEKRSRRESTQRFWSNGLFGVGQEPEVIPYDAESSMVLFKGMYQNGNTDAVVKLNNEYRDSEVFKSDNLVSAEYTENGWEFREHKEREIGDPLPGEDDFFELVE